MATSKYLAEKFLNSVLRGESFPAIQRRFVALFTTNPGEDGTMGVEVTGGGYVRKETEFVQPFQEGEITYCANKQVLEMGVATEIWGNITHVGIYDSVTGGNQLYYGSVETSKVIEKGDSLRYLSGKLKIGQL